MMKVERTGTEKIPKGGTPASLWNGRVQLPGTLSLTSKDLIFQPNDFGESHLSLEIPLKTIEKMETFLIFGMSRKGLRITGSDGRTDLFIIENPARIIKAVK